MKKFKLAICPACNGKHKVWDRNVWLAPTDRVIGFQTWFYCPSGQEGILKFYGPDMRYIGYEKTGEVPF